MAFLGDSFFQIPRPILREGFLNVEVIAGTKTLTASSSPYQSLSAAAPQNCLLPLLQDGIRYKILASGAANVVVKTSDGLTTVATLAPGDVADCICNGTVWVSF